MSNALGNREADFETAIPSMGPRQKVVDRRSLRCQRLAPFRIARAGHALKEGEDHRQSEGDDPEGNGRGA